jgi:HSP20 family protein
MTIADKTAKLPSVRSFFNDLLERDDFFPRISGNNDFFPAVNVKETEQGYEIELASPGLKKEDFQVSVENDTLIIQAETKKEEEEKDKRYTRKEFSYKSFKQSFRLPENIREEDMKATYSDGVLKIFLRKSAQKKTDNGRKITIE